MAGTARESGTVVTGDVVAFLRTRLDEDEAAARAANGPHWRPGDGNISEGGLYALDGDGADEGRGWAIAWFDLGQTNPGRQLPALSSIERHAHANSVHAAKHDPARALREVEAKRRILALVTVNADGEPIYVDGYAEAWMDVLRLLALPYASHPDYDPALAPR